MATIFKVYEELVMDYYRHRKAINNLPLSLNTLTPAEIKAECERVCIERFDKKDENLIRVFFGKGGDQKACLNAIQLCKPGKFKPLITYLKREGDTKTREKNILLLAWLIDYPDRPFDYTKSYKAPEWPHNKPKREDDTPGKEAVLLKRPEVQENGPITGGKADDPGSQVEPPTDLAGKDAGFGAAVVVASEEATPEWKYRKLFLVALLLLSGGGAGLFWWWDNRQTNLTSINNPGGCMYWADDHYQPVPCNQKMPNKRLVALDTVLVKNFRKITQPDTITYRAKGWVWYSKINNKVEFFTSDGEHPVIYGRYLKPITDRIIDIHIK